MASTSVEDRSIPAKRQEREVKVMTRAVIDWGHARWPGCRAICELAMGERRVDVVFVCTADIIGIEIKSSVDRLDRLEAQMKEFTRYLPEVWVAVAPKWRPALDANSRIANKLVVEGGAVETIGRYREKLGDGGKRPARDELIELLWRAEAAAIAERTGVVPGATHTQMRNGKLYPMLARLLTGNQIIREVCRELRERPLGMVGRGSDPPVRPSEKPASALARLGPSP